MKAMENKKEYYVDFVGTLHISLPKESTEEDAEKKFFEILESYNKNHEEQFKFCEIEFVEDLNENDLVKEFHVDFNGSLQITMSKKSNTKNAENKFFKILESYNKVHEEQFKFCEIDVVSEIL